MYFLYPQEACGINPTSSNGLFVKGCLEVVVDEVEKHSAIVGGVAIGVIVVMVRIVAMAAVKPRALCKLS